MNWSNLRRSGGVPPWPPILLAIGLASLPARWGGRRTAASFLVFAVPALSVLVSVSWVPFNDRYLLPWIAPLCALVPVGLASLADRLHVRKTDGALAVLGLVWTVVGWPGIRPGDLLDPLQDVRRRGAEIPLDPDVRAVIARWARDDLGPGDRLIDCGDVHLDVLLLPFRPNLLHAPFCSEACGRFVRDPPHAAGDQWLLTFHPPPVPGRVAAAPPEAIGAAGWEEVPIDLGLEPGTFEYDRWKGIRRWRYRRDP